MQKVSTCKYTYDGHGNGLHRRHAEIGVDVRRAVFQLDLERVEVVSDVHNIFVNVIHLNAET